MSTNDPIPNIFSFGDDLSEQEQLTLAYGTLKSLHWPVLWLDEQGKVIYANPSAIRYFRFPDGKINPELIQSLISEKTGQLLWPQITEQKPQVLKTKSGQSVWSEFISFSFGNDRKMYCWICKEITDEPKNSEIKEDFQNTNDSQMLDEVVVEQYNLNNIITVSPKYKRILEQVIQVAETEATVLILGETGTGKELLARAIHVLSDRSHRPIIKVNCAALPKDLIESELFGHEKGAFTGASNRRIGRFEMANEGTIFLDEIGEMPLGLQSKLLRVLQEGEFERVGGNKMLATDVRVIAATNRNLRKMIEKGTFREDLYYRINVFPIFNIPLRKRKEDIPVLVKYFVEKINKKLGKRVRKINDKDLSRLENYKFPGNIRELENIVERAVILSSGETLNLKSSFISRGPVHSADFKERFLSFEDMQRQHIIAALKKTYGKVGGKNGAAELLDLNDRTLRSKMRKLNVQRQDFI